MADRSALDVKYASLDPRGAYIHADEIGPAWYCHNIFSDCRLPDYLDRCSKSDGVVQGLTITRCISPAGLWPNSSGSSSSDITFEINGAKSMAPLTSNPTAS